MMKHPTYIILLIFLVIFGCTKNFEELDRPKTTSDRIDPNALFTRSLVTGSGLSVGIWQWAHQIAGSVYAQHLANIQTGANFTSDNYEPRSWDVVWDWYYARSNFAPLHYNYHVIILSRELENPVKEAVARIWNTYMVQQMTDMYGDMPLSEAFASMRPAFDSQRDIYMHLLRELTTAVDMIEQYKGFGYEGFGQADVLYNGNLDHWVAFAHGMLMRLALRASNTSEFESNVLPYLQNLDQGKSMRGNHETARIIPDPDGPTYHVKNPLVYVYAWNEVRMSKTMFDILDRLNDPRMMVFAEPNAGNDYVGLPNGQPHEQLSQRYHSYYRPNYCNLGQFFIRDDTPHFLLTYAETCFLKAEAAQRGFISGDAGVFYRDGIVASMQQLGITDQQVIDQYLNGEAAFDPANALEQIYTQRWIALFPNGHEAWSLVRRTGYPVMNKPVYTYPDNDQMPRRKMFPLNEKQANAANYQAAVDRMGGDSQYTRVWWDGGN